MAQKDEEEQSEQVVQEDPEKLQGKEEDDERHEPSPKRLFVFSLAALGVVYGDIGTSPLYALRKCFHGVDSVPVNPENVLGVLSLIFWSLIIVISVKYIVYIMRAGNEGEGGILALMSLIATVEQRSRRRFVVILGLFGAALLYGDGMITPAISVMGWASSRAGLKSL
jgi:KUP system potassium uptake protein